MDIFEFALKMELDGKAYYEQLAAEATVPGFDAIFRMLASDEQKHYDVIKGMREGSPLPFVDTTVLEGAKNIFQELKGRPDIPGSVGKTSDAYAHARKLEADSIRLYEDMASRETNRETAALLLRIAEEEKKHFNIMDNLYDFALRPSYYLEWREFGNLGQL